MITVIPTIDVEGVHGPDPFETLVLGNLGDDENWGVYRQAKIFSKYGVSATFFVDVYEYTLWGENRIKTVCQKLTDLGHDVQLHTHPGWRNDDQRDLNWLRELKTYNSYLSPEKDFMTKLSYQEQCDVLQHGCDLLEHWIGEKPIAHRSGGYSINNDTLRALKVVGIPIDSSMNSIHPNSQVTWSFNSVEERDGIIEIPVTIGRYTGYLGAGPLKYPFYKRLVKTDHNIINANDILSYIDDAQRKNTKLVNLFLHSFSLIERGATWQNPKPSLDSARNLEEILDTITKLDDVQIMSCKEFYSYYQRSPDVFQGDDAIPNMEINWSKMLRYGIRKTRRILLQ